MSEVAENLDDTSAAPVDGAVEEPTMVDDPTIAANPDDDGTVIPNATWPEDWRDKFAGDDEKLLGRLKRFAGPENVVKSWLNAEKKISSGQMRFDLPENPTDEDLASYREANGIPGDWTEYSTDLPEGVVFGDEDKAVIDAFLESAHGANMPQEYVTPALQWYHQFQEDSIAEQTGVGWGRKNKQILSRSKKSGAEITKRI